jgi:Dihydrodipicolinate synthase/N-acetylneuraminate lyase
MPAALMEIEMPRHKTYVPHGVIPAVILPFHDDLSIDEPNFRKHLRDVTAAEGLSAVTINAHSTEVRRAPSTSRSACSTSPAARSATTRR